MAFLVDTNVLLRSIDLAHPMNRDAVDTLRTLQSREEQLCIVPQNLIEFWNVYTRPLERNGLGGTPEEAESEVMQLKALFTLLPDTPAIYPTWEQLVSQYRVRGVNVHDARLVAAMIVHRLTHILTFNDRDFMRYSEITVIVPKTD